MLSKQLQDLLIRICDRTGMSKSEVLRHAFIEYARALNLIEEAVHGRD